MRALVAIGDVIQRARNAACRRGAGSHCLRHCRAGEQARVCQAASFQLAQKRWKVDVNSKQDAHLMLSAVNLPGGIQAEVQSASQDSIHLHTRSLKYGKLQMGQLVKVEPYLIKRLSQHFHSFGQYQVEVIFGCNGYVWISSVAQREQQQQQLEEDGAAIPIPLATRERICRVGNAVRALASQGLVVSPDSVVAAYEASVGWGIEPKDMLARAFGERLVARENHK
ncbi:exosome complex component RRP4 homolog [Selaginella moellendorffii]|uniref:exosome complex component RRP4 homolog n=1 Tax=Selaginella moellendorffii TaxID=88036 RepID=UPI000D1C547D|nr:exosome complex component RRP4 homolog [Selaginella moellendorffii]|eukprot:XP_024532408.1 exosome complex component RRP4 homolog [Selaginella moellendorffii]